METMDKTTSSPLVRGIGKWDLVALIINSIVGAGIFGLPSTVYALTGADSILGANRRGWGFPIEKLI
jgi:amino acid transporter